MNRIIKAAAIAVIAGIGVIGTASATSAASGGTVAYKGNGFTAGVLNTDAPSLEQDSAQDGYLMWVLSANGATKATIHLPGGVIEQMTAKGGNFKFESQYFSPEALKDVTADYTGSVKGNVVLTVSHGHEFIAPVVKADTNVLHGITWDKNTGTGTIGRDAAGETDLSTAMFTEVQTLVTDKSWNANSGEDNDGDGLFRRHKYTTSATTYNVVATPVEGDNTGAIVGWTLVRGTVDSRTPVVGSGDTYLYDLRLDPVTGVGERQTHTLTYDLQVNGTTVSTDFITG